MSTEKDLLEIYKERIKQESKLGDKADAIKLTGVTNSTYYAGIKKSKYAELTNKEEKVIDALIEILNQRKQKRYASN